MAIIAYTLAQKVHFADPQDGDIAGDIADVLVVDTIAKTGTVYRSGAQIGTAFYITAAQASGLVTAGWLTANTTMAGVPGGKGSLVGWTAATGITAGSRLGITSVSATAGQVAAGLAALIADLTAAGVIGV